MVAQYKSEIQALIDFMNSPLYENGSSVVDSLRNKFDEEKLKFLDERSIEKKWEIFNPDSWR